MEPKEQKEIKSPPEKLLDELTINVKSERENMLQNIKELAEQAKNADGPWQSASDTSRRQNSWLANSLLQQLDWQDLALQKTQDIITTKLKDPTKRVSIGTILRLKEKNLEENLTFFCVEEGLGGRELLVDGETYITISQNTKIVRDINNGSIDCEILEEPF